MIITSKYPGKCAGCACAIPAGEEVEWDRERRVIYHPECAPTIANNPQHPDGPAAQRSEQPTHNRTVEGSTPSGATTDWKSSAKTRVDAKGGAHEPPKYDPIPMFEGSDEQKTIWEYQLNGSAHMVINAGPGTGKTATEIGYCLRAPRSQRILFVAFNKHIAAEANGKLQATKLYNVKACTYHSLGYAMLRNQFKSLGDPDEGKMTAILESLSPPPIYGKGEWRKALNLAEKLVSYVKNYHLDYSAIEFGNEIEAIADHHALEMNGKFGEALSLVRPALNECKRMASVKVDFNDMVWLPVVLNLSYPNPVDMMITDESQDLNKIQHELMFRVAGSSTRCVVVGDKRQAIYSFRGASTTSIEDLSARLGETKRGVREFPLTVTRRCPKLHVQLAQSLFPEISALDDAPVGEILTMNRDKAAAELRVGDMVICRVNAELVPMAYDLIRRDIRPVIKGRDIGKGLLQLIERLEKAVTVIPLTKRCLDCEESTRIACATCQGRGVVSDEMGCYREALKIYQDEEMSKLLPKGDKAAGRISALQDKCDCLSEFIDNSKTAAEMKTRITTLFSDDDPKNCVVLGTVHRTKGLESPRVFILAPELIPHPMARQDWERAQERNLAWVACTRAKFDNKTGVCGTIVFCGPIPAIYQAPAPYPAPDVEELELNDGNATRVTAGHPRNSSGELHWAVEEELARQKSKHEDDIPVASEGEDNEPPF